MRDNPNLFHSIDLSRESLSAQELHPLVERELQRVRTTGHPCYIRLSDTPIRAVVSDLDGTLISGEMMPLLSKELGIEKPMQRLTLSAMRGETNFATSFRQRTLMLAGLPRERLLRLAQQIPLAGGVEAGFALLSERGIPATIASGAYVDLVQGIALRLGVDAFIGSEPEILEGQLTGAFSGQIVCPEDKAEFLGKRAQQLGIVPSDFLSIGDGANDLEMFLRSGHILLYSATEEAVAPPLDELFRSLL